MAESHTPHPMPPGTVREEDDGEVDEDEDGVGEDIGHRAGSKWRD